MEDPEFSVLLTAVGDRRLEVVGVIRSESGRNLWDSRLLTDAVPAVVVTRVPFDRADGVARLLEAAGGKAALRCDSCRRGIPRGSGPVDPGPCEAQLWPAGSCRASSPAD